MDGRRLTRSSTDKRLGGVCGGLAEYFGVDPLFVRLVFVATALAGGFGILLYVVLWIALPEAPPGAVPSPRYSRASSAVRIAEERYARGEISAEELRQIRSDLTESS
jgi:phage shock protein PspC (stress-responsive transcriptional regulator)